MEFRDVLISAAKTVDERNKEYGTIDECFSRITKISSAFFNEEIDEYKVAMILLFVKLGRIGDNKQYDDNYIDGVNYLAFASQFANSSARGQKTAPPPSFRAPLDRVDQIRDYEYASRNPSNFDPRGARGA